MRKDLGICSTRLNGTAGAWLPVTALVDQFYKDVQAMRAASVASSVLAAGKVRGMSALPRD